MASRIVSATEFKAKCLSILDEVDQGKGTITITKRGRPVAVLSAPKRKGWKFPFGALEGKIVEEVDLANYDTSHLWDVVREK